MTKAAALQSFFDSFGMPAYPDTAVPADVTFPYITYSGASDAMGEEVSLSVRIWHYTDSEAVPNAKAEELGKRIDMMAPIPCDGGYLWIKRGRPFCLSQNDQVNSNIKLRFINVTVAFLTKH